MSVSIQGAESSALDQLSAVRVVLSAERLTTEFDILVSTAIEALRGGPRSTEDLLRVVRETWPGAPTQLVHMTAAMTAAETGGYVVAAGSEWALSMQGLAEAAEARKWAEGAFDRALVDLETRATQALRPITREEARLWLGILVTALFDGIKWANAAYQGDVTQLPDRAIAPRTIDKKKLFAAIGRLADRAEVREFLEAIALDAIDPSQPFGNEVVSYIATGYVLHAFMARRDALASRKQVPSMEGIQFLLDTPLLFPLLDAGGSTDAVRDAVASAISVGAEVVVCEHNLNELQSVADRIRARYLPQLNTALSDGSNALVLRQLVDEPLIELFVTGVGDGRWRDWKGFQTHLGRLRKSLTALGVSVEPHGNTAADRVGDCFSALGKSMQRSTHGRGANEMERDANTMARAWRIRRDKPRLLTWPTAWVVTPDTHMSRAYRNINPKDKVPIAISASQWVALLSTVVPPASLDRLAVSGATLLTQESFFRVAARFPPDIVISMARALADDGSTTALDVRVGQLTLDDVLSAQPSLVEDPVAAGVQMAAALVARRSQRVAKAQEYAEERLSSDRERLTATVTASAQALSAERDLRLAAEAKTALVLSGSESTATALNRGLTLQRRSHIVIVLLGLMGMTVIGLAVGAYLEAIAGGPAWRWLVFAVATSLSALLVWARSRDWVSAVETKWTVLVAAIVPELVGVAVNLLPWILAAASGTPAIPGSPSPQ